MPVWDLKCNKCGRVYRDYGLNGVDMLQKCVCGNSELVKMPAAPAVKFKGDGWQTKQPKASD